MSRTTQIARSFGAAARTYSNHSSVQESAAKHLKTLLSEIKGNLPPGPVLEIACGTGIFTNELIKELPERNFTISDIAQEMLETCRENTDTNAEYIILNAEEIRDTSKYALIVCAFAAQWFNNLEATIDAILNALSPGGYFIFSIPTNKSFPEWKAVCIQNSLPYSGNSLPEIESIERYCQSKGLTVTLKTQAISTSYQSSLSFFQALKGLGAAMRVQKTTPSSPSPQSNSLLSVIRKWDKERSDNISVTYEVLFGALRKQ